MARVLLYSVLSFVMVFLFFQFKGSKRKNGPVSGFVRSFLKAAAPDQMEETEIDDLENSKMVSEGSQFGVQYFNEFMYDTYKDK